MHPHPYKANPPSDARAQLGGKISAGEYSGFTITKIKFHLPVTHLVTNISNAFFGQNHIFVTHFVYQTKIEIQRSLLPL